MEHFVNRLAFLLENLDYTASAFADKIGVQRSSLSHLLSGRNKPSLDFIMKINDAFPEISLTWILKGKGNYLESENTTSITKIVQHPTTTIAPPIDPITGHIITDSKEQNTSNSQDTSTQKQVQINTENDVKNNNTSILNQLPFQVDSNVDQIVVFYKDGTFRQFKPRH